MKGGDYSSQLCSPEAVSKEPPPKRSALSQSLNQSHVKVVNSRPISSINTKILGIHALLPPVTTSWERPLRSLGHEKTPTAPTQQSHPLWSRPRSHIQTLSGHSHITSASTHTNSPVPIYTSHPGNGHGKTSPPHYQCIQCCLPLIVLSVSDVGGDRDIR